MKNFASYTKTGRGIAIGEAIGKSICRGGGGGSKKETREEKGHGEGSRKRRGG